MASVPFIVLLWHDFDHGVAFMPNILVILFRSSTICRIFQILDCQDHHFLNVWLTQFIWFNLRDSKLQPLDQHHHILPLGYHLIPIPILAILEQAKTSTTILLFAIFIFSQIWPPPPLAPYAEKFPLTSMGGWAECPAVRTGERGPPSASAEIFSLFFLLPFNSSHSPLAF
jgi:hypothetical protein